VESDVRVLRVLLGRCGLAQPSGWLPFMVYQTGKQYGADSAGWPFCAPLSRSATVRGWWQSYFIYTTNDASNYWRFHLVKIGPGVQSTIKVLNTNGGTYDNWQQVSDANLDHPIAAPTYVVLRMYIDKVGSPGALYLAAPAVFVT
jgi:hypothetical protein